MIKALRKLGIQGNLLSLRNSYKRPTANITLNEKLRAISLRSGTRQGLPLSLLLFNIVLQVQANAVRLKKEIKGV